MAISLICVRPNAGEVWDLDDGEAGLVLRAGEQVVTVIPGGEASLRVQLPNFFGSRYITIDLGRGNLVCFEPKPETVAQVRALLGETVSQNPDATAASFDKKANRDLLIGGGSMLLGIVITAWSFLAAAPGGTFTVTTGLLGVGLVEIIRGIYFKSKASESKRSAVNR